MSLKFFTLASGSSGNATFVGSKKTQLLVDAGLSGREIERKLKEKGILPEDLAAILVTHEHKDHIKGVGVLSRRYDLPVYATQGTWEGMEREIGEIAEHNKRYLELGQGEEIGEIKVEVLATSHDAREPAAFAFYQGESSVGLATDTGKITRDLRKHITGCQGVIMEANHDPTMLRKGPYPPYLKKRIASVLGHLSNQMSGDALAEFITGKTQQVILAHLSAENNLPSLALQTVREILAEQGFTQMPKITVAPRHEAHPLCETLKEPGIKRG